MSVPDVFPDSLADGPSLADIEAALRELGGYYHMTLDDFRSLYRHAFRAARTRPGDIMELFRKNRINRAPALNPDGTPRGLASRSDILHRRGGMAS